LEQNNIIVVGYNSFIGKRLSFKADWPNNVLQFSYDKYLQQKPEFLKQANVVINCALDPRFKTHNYNEKFDVDFQVARQAYENGSHFIMMSTRKVYGNSPEFKIYSETSPVNPVDFYSENKLMSEYRIRAYFGDKATILRGSNLYGYEPGRKSFMGYCMDQLLSTGKIEYTFSPYNQRDFIYIDNACKLILKVARKKPTGVFNLGAGFSIDVGNIGKYLILGFFSDGPFNNSYLITKNENFDKMEDQFGLSVYKLYSTLFDDYNDWPGIVNHEKIIISLGRQLKESISYGGFCL